MFKIFGCKIHREQNRPWSSSASSKFGAYFGASLRYIYEKSSGNYLNEAFQHVKQPLISMCTMFEHCGDDKFWYIARRVIAWVPYMYSEHLKLQCVIHLNDDGIFWELDFRLYSMKIGLDRIRSIYAIVADFLYISWVR